MSDYFAIHKYTVIKGDGGFLGERSIGPYPTEDLARFKAMQVAIDQFSYNIVDGMRVCCDKVEVVMSPPEPSKTTLCTIQIDQSCI